MAKGDVDVSRRIRVGVRERTRADAVNAGADRGASALPRRGAVYVDEAIWEWRGLKWAHLLADDIDDLHRFAAALGIHRTSYQGPPRTSVPHYDLTSYERRRAIAHGAIACGRDEIVAVVRRMVRRARSRNRFLAHISPRVGFFVIWDPIERGLVRLLGLGRLLLLFASGLLLRSGMLPALSAHLGISRRGQDGDAR